MKAVPELKGVCVCSGKASSLCHALNIFDDGKEKNEFSVSPEYRNEKILSCNYN